MVGWLTQVAESFWTGMLVHLWQTTLVLLVLWGLSRTLRDAPARLQAALWWIGLLKLLLPLSLLAPWTTRWFHWIPDRFDTASTSSGVQWISATLWLQPVTDRAAVETAAAPAAALYLALLFAWCVCLVWILARRLRRSRRDRSIPLIPNGDGPALLERKLGEALASTQIEREMIRLVRGSGMPAVRGLFQTRIELPEQVVERLATADLTAVLLHEEEHRRRKDPLRRLPAVLASWLFFFYPPLRWLLRRLYETTEMACDEAVLRSGVVPRDYARSIARTLTLTLGLGPTEVQPALIGPSRSSLRRRLARLNVERRYQTMPAHRIVLALAVLIALLGSVVPLTPGTQAADETPVATGSGARFVVLDRLVSVSTEVTLEFDDSSVRTILDALSRAASFELELAPDINEKPISISLEGGTVRQALVELAGLVDLHYEVPEPATLRVRSILLPGKDGVTSPQRIEESVVQPVYPEEMRQAKIEGRVILQATIESSGAVTDLEVLKADHPTFAKSAIAAIEQWRYEPATLEGRPVSVYFTIVIEFRLNGAKPKPEEAGETL